MTFVKFLRALNSDLPFFNESFIHMTKKLDLDAITLAYNTAQRRLILLDYDGTLVPFERYPEMAKPKEELKLLITRLASDYRNHVMIISGRSKANLDDFWNGIPIILTAEHGGFYKNPDNIWHSLFPGSHDWVEKVYTAIKGLAFQYEGSIVEKKEFSLTWHYRPIADRITDGDKAQILAAFRELPEHKNFEIYDDKFTIELRTPGINKGSFVARWMGSKEYDFILALGDSQTDEDLFDLLDMNAFSIRVEESTDSKAQYHLNSQKEVTPFIKDLLDVNEHFDKISFKVGLQRH